MAHGAWVKEGEVGFGAALGVHRGKHGTAGALLAALSAAGLAPLVHD